MRTPVAKSGAAKLHAPVILVNAYTYSREDPLHTAALWLVRRTTGGPLTGVHANQPHACSGIEIEHLLRPFLIGRDCPTCRTWSTFHADRVPRTAVFFKSLGHGHTLEDASADTPRLLKQIGLV